MNRTILAWHFGEKCLGFNDGRQSRVGVRQRYRPPKGCRGLKMDRSGFHASVDIFKALYYARGPILRRVELSGKMIVGSDKICAEYRRPLWMVGGEKLLRRCACLCAADVLHLWDAQDIVIRYLRTQDESIRDAALAFALASREASTGASMRAAAGSAAGGISRAVAWGVAEGEPGGCAWDTAAGAMRNAVWAAVFAAMKDFPQTAAWDARRGAVWAAAESKQKRRLVSMASRAKRQGV